MVRSACEKNLALICWPGGANAAAQPFQAWVSTLFLRRVEPRVYLPKSNLPEEQYPVCGPPGRVRPTEN